MNEQNPAEPTPTPQEQSFYGKHKWLKWGLLYLAIALGVPTIAFGSFYASFILEKVLSSSPYSPPPPARVTQPTPTPDETANWKIYENTALKYSVKYPSDKLVRLICPHEELILIKREPNELRDEINRPDCYRADRYDIEVVTSVGDDGRLDEEPKSSGFYDEVTKEEVKVGDLAARKYTASRIPKDQYESPIWYAEAFINHDVRIHQIYTEDKQLLPIFDKILSTFKFLDQTTPTPTSNPNQVLCTRDVKLCPDGSYVGRQPPNCEFAPCP